MDYDDDDDDDDDDKLQSRPTCFVFPFAIRQCEDWNAHNYYFFVLFYMGVKLGLSH